MDEARLFAVLDAAAEAVRHALDGLDEWGPAGTRPGQYHLDLAADAAALPILHGAGLAVLSEESGATGDPAAGLLAVIDPVDGSTNAHRRIPFYATSICVLDAEGPLVGVVVNQATGTRYAAAREVVPTGMAPLWNRRAAGTSRPPSWRFPDSRGVTRAGLSFEPWARRPWSSARWPRDCSTPTWWWEGARSSAGIISPGS